MINGHTIVFNEDLKALKSRLIWACQKQDKDFFKRFGEISQEVLENHLKIVPYLENSKASLKLLSKFLDSAKLVMVPWMLTVFHSDFMGDILAETAAKYGLDINKVINCVPKKETLMIKEYREALEIKKELLKKFKSPKNALDKVKDDEILWKAVCDHVKKYEWVGTHHFWGEPLTEVKFLKEIVNLKEEISKVKKMALPKEIKFQVKAATEMGFLRQYSAEAFDLVAFKARKLLEETARKLDLNYEELLLLTPTEIKNCLKKKIQPSKIDILKRKRGFCILKKESKEMVVDNDQEIKMLTKRLVPCQDLSVSQFKGTTACGGWAKGKVKVFLVPENLSKMKPGDILVTTMTTPDFV